MDLVLESFLLSFITGMATGISGIMVLLLKKVSDRFVGFSMGFASGVMLLVSFNNLFLEAEGLLTHLELIIIFSLGALVMMALDLTIPHIELTTRKRNGKNQDGKSQKMFSAGVLIAVGITLHNLPEGLVVAAGYMYLPRLGLIIAITIMLHNIPEGVATAIPFTSTDMKPFKIAAITFLSGLSEPVGALIGAATLSLAGTKSVIGSSLAFAAGVMTYLTADELIPMAHEYGHKHIVSIGLLFVIIFALLVDVILS